TRRAQELIPELIVANGNCSAYTGAGDPYLPFREILGLLTGDIEAHWAAATITQEHARRLWQISPLAAQALVVAGPDLLDTFVPRTALRERATMFAPRKADWLLRLDGAVERRMAVSTGGGTLLQGDIFEQYTRVLQDLAGQAPLLLVLDDLQWADVGSISLLFHLGRRLAGSRILILGAYRPEEVALGREGQRHPLEAVVNELQRDYGEIVVNLDQAGNRDFLEALLDSEPNRLGPEFREMFYRQTGGHPLFTIELLRGLQQRGDLSRDAQDSWVEGPKLDWEQLPARVEAVVAERIGRLPRPLQAALRVASVEGEIFTAEVVARLRGISDQEMLEHLSSNLDRQHRLVRSHSIQRVEGHTLSRYKFRHILFQRYLYGNLNEVERVHLHEQVGVALEELCGVEAQTGATAVQLALHFRKARITQKAIYYLCRAGERAVKLNAHQEALTHLTMGLDLLRTLPDSLEQEQQELDLQIALGLAWIGPVGYGPEAQEAFTRAAELCRQLGKASQLCQVVGHLATRHYVGGEHRRARQLAEEALSIAERVREPLLLEEAHWRLGFILFALGEYSEAHSQLQQVISFSEPEQHQLVLGIHPVDPRASALAYDACCLWCLGYPDQGFSRSQEAFAVARRLNHPLSLLDVVCYAGCMFGSLRRDGQALSEHAAELIELPKQQGFWGWLTCGIRYRGEALAVLGQLQEGLVQMREGVTDEAGFVRLYLSGTLGHLALAQGMTGHPLEGLTTLEEALAIVERTGERHWAAELHRLRGELLLMVGREAEAEASYLKAVEIARQQSAKSWELRATVSLCALWRRQGKAREASEMLRGIYGWFTEGFDSQDLREARALLQHLAPAT
ncbi:MAG: ATP-binding protein, partial [Anaerolineae bacterium]